MPFWYTKIQIKLLNWNWTSNKGCWQPSNQSISWQHSFRTLRTVRIDNSLYQQNASLSWRKLKLTMDDTTKCNVYTCIKTQEKERQKVAVSVCKASFTSVFLLLVWSVFMYWSGRFFYECLSRKQSRCNRLILFSLVRVGPDFTPELSNNVTAVQVVMH